MSEKQIALRVIARLNNPTMHTPGRRPYTLPEPTIEDIAVWLEYEQIYYRLGVIERYSAMQGGYDWAAHYKNERDYCERLAALAEKLVQEGAITQEQYARIKQARPYTDNQYTPDSKARAEMRKQIKRWRPADYGNTTHHSETTRVYTATSAEGEEIYLTFEDGQWWRHDDYPYPHWSPEH